MMCCECVIKMPKRQATIEFIDGEKKVKEDDEETETSSVQEESKQISLERLSQEHQGVLYTLDCPICNTYLGTDLAIDDHEQMNKFHEIYFGIRDVVSLNKLVTELTNYYNNHLADEGETIQEAQTRNHFLANHLQDSYNSLSKTIRNLETIEDELAKQCFEKESSGKNVPNEKNIEMMMRVASMKMKAYHEKDKRKAGTVS